VATSALPLSTPPPAKPSVLSPDPIIVQAQQTTDTAGDTARGNGSDGSADGRTGQQQNQQSHQPQRNQQNQTR
jgi:hypothetical protein